VSGLRARGLEVRFGDRAILAGADLDVAPGERVGVLGPSGSGKSTLLRTIAGLQPIDAGTIQWDSTDLAALPPHRRGVGLLFQDLQLFPHRDVGANVGFGLRMQRRPAAEITRRVADLLELVGLPGTQRRAVATLSGGEAQRVALARALAPAPRLLLLDEPFSALDRDLHDRLVGEVGDLLGRLGIAAIHVTHDPAEAEHLCHRVLVLRDGRLVPR